MASEEHAKSKLKALLAECSTMLRRECGEWIASDPSGFRSFVLGTLKATLPRQRAGRKCNPVVQHANRLYEAQRENGGQANWGAIAGAVHQNYASLAPAIQRCMRMKLRAEVHSYRHGSKQRANLQKVGAQALRPAENGVNPDTM